MNRSHPILTGTVSKQRSDCYLEIAASSFEPARGLWEFNMNSCSIVRVFDSFHRSKCGSGRRAFSRVQTLCVSALMTTTLVAASGFSARVAPQAETPQAEKPQAEKPQAETPQAETPHAETPHADWHPRAIDYYVLPQAFDELVEAGQLPEGELRDTADVLFKDYRQALRALDESTDRDMDSAGRRAYLEFIAQPGARGREDFEEQCNKLFTPAVEVFLERLKSSDAMVRDFIASLEVLVSPQRRSSFREVAEPIVVFHAWRARCANNREHFGYGQYTDDCDVDRLLTDFLKGIMGNGALAELAVDPKFSEAHDQIERARSQFRAEIVPCALKSLSLTRMPLSQRSRTDSQGRFVAINEHHTNRVGVACANRRLIDAVAEALANAGKSSDLEQRWLSMAWEAATPDVMASGAWSKSACAWTAERQNIPAPVAESIGVECSSMESERWQLVLAVAGAAFEHWIAEELGDADLQLREEQFMRAAAKLWKFQAVHLTRVRSMLPADHVAAFDNWLGKRPTDPSLLPCLDFEQVEWIETQGLGPKRDPQRNQREIEEH